MISDKILREIVEDLSDKEYELLQRIILRHKEQLKGLNDVQFKVKIKELLEYKQEKVPPIVNKVHIEDDDSDFFYTKVVGVTFENRQDIIKQINEGDSITLVHDFSIAEDDNAIRVDHELGVIGYLKRDVAKRLVDRLDECGEIIAVVKSITGKDKFTLGVNIAVPRDK